MDSDSSTKFIASLTKFLQSLCNGYVEFQNGVELAGHIYLSIDTGEKVDYILHEKVCKNDENSVTFISNSFHALPAEKRKDGKQQSEQSKGAQSKTSGDSEKSDSRSRDDDDDVVIVDQDSSSGGTASSRGVKRAASPSSDQKQRTQSQRNMPGSFQGSTARQGIRGNRQQPTATVTSQEQRGENFDVGDVKLEQMTTDELLSLASQVGDSSGGPSHRSAAASSNNQPPPRLRGPRGDAPAEMWIKQEVNDDADVPGGSDSGQSWPHGRDDSNSGPGGGLYPVMLHQNTAAFSPTSGFPVGFPGMPGSSASTSQHPGLGQPVPSTAGSNPYANPIPGTSQGAGAVDPAGLLGSAGNAVGARRASRMRRDAAVFENFAASVRARGEGGRTSTDTAAPTRHSTMRVQQFRARLKRNPDQYRAYKEKQRQYRAKHRAKKKAMMQFVQYSQ